MVLTSIVGIPVCADANLKNGKLIEADTVTPGSSKINRTQYTSKATRSDILEANDYITKVPATNTSPTRSVNASSIRLGSINYAIHPSTYQTESVSVYYKTSSPYPDTYEVNRYRGTVVNLVAILIGAIELPAVMAASFVARLLACAGKTVVAGSLSSALTDTVSAIRTDYAYTISNLKVTSHKRTIIGSKYIAISGKYQNANKTFYEGIQPSQWKTSFFANTVYDEMFGYSICPVLSWGK